MPEILLVDGYSLLFRGFHALPLLTSSNGTFTNAVHGFFSMLLRALGDYRPDGVIVMLDVHAPTFRHAMYSDYKGTRKPMPEELRPQTKLLRELLDAMKIRVCELEGYEADDLLGTAARMAAEEGLHSIILTGDRDSLQLVNESTKVLLTKKGITESLLLDAQGVLTEYGFTPEQVPDMKGLMGDSSDNIPGIPGIGEKTALKLMQEYGSLDAILEHGSQIKGKLGERIRLGRDSALMSRKLGTICRTAPISLDFHNCTWYRMDEAAPELEKYGLNTVLHGILQLLGKQEAKKQGTEKAGSRQTKASFTMAVEDEQDIPSVAQPAVEKTITDEAELRSSVQKINVLSDIVISVCILPEEISLYAAGELWHIPTCHSLIDAGLDQGAILQELQPLLTSFSVIVHGGKEFFRRLDHLGIGLPEISLDTELAAYLLHTAQKDYTLVTTLETEYGQIPESITAWTVFALAQRQEFRLKSRKMSDLLKKMEQPLSRVLFEMEKTGFLIDRSVLQALEKWYTGEIETCRTSFFQAAGVREFNLNSPRQLGELLYEKLGLPAPQKKGKTGYTTSAEVLEELAPLHPCIEPLLRYRKMMKLQSTYIDALLKLSRTDSRIHTTFDQTATVTGRISSLEPNLQNIPIRTEEGREIRRAFIAREGCVLLDADYSQIELRVLAHMSEDAAMCDAFCRGQDIHTHTAAQIRGVPMDKVTPEMRRAAKATNFGIVYGISAFGLSRNAHISRQEAKEYIDLYFRRYPGVKAFMDNCIQKGRELGYAETMFGRRRELFELSSTNRNVRSFGERAAMNTPVQGTAADIIKLAMVQVSEKLRQNGWKARLILQVHDELVLQCPDEEAKPVAAMLKQTMEQVCQLRVPLIAQVAIGKNWEESH